MGYRRPLASQGGLSLVETMVALVVIVIGLAAVQRYFPQGLAMSRHSRERTQATLLGHGKLEQLRLQGFDALAASGLLPTTPEPFRDSRQRIMFPGFRWQTEVMRHAEDLLEVRLRVVWPWPRQMHQVDFATYVSMR